MPTQPALRFRERENQVVSCSFSVRSWGMADVDDDRKCGVIYLAY